MRKKLSIAFFVALIFCPTILRAANDEIFVTCVCQKYSNIKIGKIVIETPSMAPMLPSKEFIKYLSKVSLKNAENISFEYMLSKQFFFRTESNIFTGYKKNISFEEEQALWKSNASDCQKIESPAQYFSCRMTLRIPEKYFDPNE